MNNNTYKNIPGTEIEGREITADFAETFAGIIARNAPLLNFPRLRFALLKCIGYSENDYCEIAGHVRSGEIRLYETLEHMEFNGKYCSDQDNNNFFVLSPYITSAPLLGEATLMHESTHAVQDLRKWRVSKLDMEVDAHFAEALYLVRNKKQNEVATDLVLTRFIIAAEQFNDDAKYFSSLHFRRLRQDMQNDVFSHYQYMHSVFDEDFDSGEFEKDYHKRHRLDGI
jgi:hypothetical protein